MRGEIGEGEAKYQIPVTKMRSELKSEKHSVIRDMGDNFVLQNIENM
jgi:hypothetical protein